MTSTAWRRRLALQLESLAELVTAEGSLSSRSSLAADADAVRAYALQHHPAAGEEQSIGLVPADLGGHDRSEARPHRGAVAMRPPRAVSFGLAWTAWTAASKLVAILYHERRIVLSFVRIEHGGRRARGELRPAPGRAPARALISLLRRVCLARRKLSSRCGVARLGDASGDAAAQRWADEVWERCRGSYSFVERRDVETLARIYPVERPRFDRLRISRAGQSIGWAVLQRAQMTGDRMYGSLHVGRITDCLAAPEDAGIVISAATDYLVAHGVDLMLTNQFHTAWCAALRRNAFLSIPSNLRAPTARLAEHPRDRPGDARRTSERGDGDGPGSDPRRL
jgi:hypothetical protein